MFDLDKHRTVLAVRARSQGRADDPPNPVSSQWFRELCLARCVDDAGLHINDRCSRVLLLTAEHS